MTTNPYCPIRSCVFATLLGLFAGCSSSPAKVKGRLVDNGQPVTFPSGAQAAVMFNQLNPDGTRAEKMYTAMLQPDGSFELVASGGQLPSGPYQVSLDIAGRKDRFKRFAFPDSPIRTELKPGPNDLTIDLAKPQG